MATFKNRVDAGKKLADKLSDYSDKDNVIILALPRGGAPVAFEVAKKINAPLDVFLVRKLGVPGREELAMGAIASGGVRVLNDDILRMLSIPDEGINRVAEKEQKELERREIEYRGDRQELDVKGKICILIDDGLATGASMRAAIKALQQMEPAKIVVAVPVGASEVCEGFENEADEVICAATPEPIHAIGAWYDNFSQTTDDEVRAILAEADKLVKSNAG
ncbi:phosphoribosyltransferase [Candidatus Poribacteria bacterium]|nr:phosphoribosyltransferase [Candidatus Poribacteria bacterium]